MINIIAAIDSKNGIGRENNIPWHCPDDLKRFKKLTTGSSVVMGRKTWESLPLRPLPNRHNVIVSSKLTGPDIAQSLLEAIGLTNTNDVWLIGGASIYQEGLYIADKLYITHMPGDYSCDRFFPPIDPNLWKAEKLKTYTDHSYCVYSRHE